MRKILFVCLFVVLQYNVSVAQEGLMNSEDHNNWLQSFELAQDLSRSDKKQLLIYFTGSDWCGPCKMLDADFFETERFIDIAARHFVLYKADTPRNLDLVTKSQKKDNDRLKKKYGVTSFPTIVVLDKNGKYLGELKGYNFLMRDTDNHYNFIESVMNN